MAAVGNMVKGIFSGPPKVPAPPPPPNPLQQPSGGQVAPSAVGSNYGGTLMTGPQGLVAPANTAKKSLLGG